MYHLCEWAEEVEAMQPVRICPFEAGRFRPVKAIASEIVHATRQVGAA
jgi:hypothetical protein